MYDHDVGLALQILLLMIAKRERDSGGIQIVVANKLFFEDDAIEKEIR